MITLAFKFVKSKKQKPRKRLLLAGFLLLLPSSAGLSCGGIWSSPWESNPHPSSKRPSRCSAIELEEQIGVQVVICAAFCD